MTQVVEKARKRLAEIEAEAEKLRTFLGVYADLTGDKPVDNEASPEDSAGYGVIPASPALIVDSAKLLMRELRRPLSRSLLVKLLKERGHNLPGKDAAKNVGTVIWRSRQFDNIAGWGYWPKDFEGWLGQRPSEQASLLGTNL